MMTEDDLEVDCYFVYILIFLGDTYIKRLFFSSKMICNIRNRGKIHLSCTYFKINEMLKEKKWLLCICFCLSRIIEKKNMIVKLHVRFKKKKLNTAHRVRTHLSHTPFLRTLPPV